MWIIAWRSSASVNWTFSRIVYNVQPFTLKWKTRISTRMFVAVDSLLRLQYLTTFSTAVMQPARQIKGPSLYPILWMASIHMLCRLLRHLFSKSKPFDIPFASTFPFKSHLRCKVIGSLAGVMTGWSVYLINVPAISSRTCSMVTVRITSCCFYFISLANNIWLSKLERWSKMSQ